MLTFPNLPALKRQLVTDHRMRVTVRIADLDGRHGTDVSDRLIDGQVNLDATAETSRAATITLDDPNHQLALDGRSPLAGGVFVDRLLVCNYGVFIPELGAGGKWIDVPVFRGPITGLSRDGTTLNLACLGKEHLAKGAAWTSMTFGKGHDTVRAIKAILRERVGEDTFDFPDHGGRLADKLSLGRTTSCWETCLRLAGSIGMRLYYDGAGVCVLRDPPDDISWTFKDGDGGSLLSTPTVSYDVSTLANTVLVHGKKNKGKPRITARAIAPRNHPLSPWNIGYKGQPRYLVAEEENDHLRTTGAAQQVANRTLDTLLDEAVEVAFDALPIPHLDPGDLIRVNSTIGTFSIRLRQASIPLNHTGVMSVGVNRQVNVRFPKGHRRRKRRG